MYKQSEGTEGQGFAVAHLGCFFMVFLFNHWKSEGAYPKENHQGFFLIW